MKSYLCFVSYDQFLKTAHAQGLVAAAYSYLFFPIFRDFWVFSGFLCGPRFLQHAVTFCHQTNKNDVTDKGCDVTGDGCGATVWCDG